MKQSLIRLSALVLALLMLCLVPAACTKTPAESGEKSGDKAQSGSTDTTADPKKVALVLEGEISDMSWNSDANSGLEKIKALGAETKAFEKIAVSAMPDLVRKIADAGFGCIFLSSSSYAEALPAIAKEFPDIMFFIINADLTEQNIRSFAVRDEEQGFIMGALAGLLTKTDKVAFIGGLEIQPILNGAKGFKNGVDYLDKGVEVLSANTKSFDDVQAAKELAKSFISRGADILVPMANQASLGVLEAAEAEGLRAIAPGSEQDQYASASVVVSVLKDTSLAYEAAYKAFSEQGMDLPREVLKFGVKENVVRLGEYKQDVPEEIRKQVYEIINKLAAGEIDAAK